MSDGVYNVADEHHFHLTQIETLTPPADGRDTTGEIIPADHGHHGMQRPPPNSPMIASSVSHRYAGPVGVSLAGYTGGTDALILNASAELSSEFPYNEDVNSGDTIGISKYSHLHSLAFSRFTKRYFLRLDAVGCMSSKIHTVPKNRATETIIVF